MVQGTTDSYAILLAGGSGSRLWPVSRELYPKQLVKLIGNRSLVQSTVDRLLPIMGPERIRIVCGKEHFFETARHMEEIGVSASGKILQEPCGRNTAPAILLSVLDILKHQGGDPVLCVFPADHVIRHADRFQDRVNTAIHLARQGHIVTFGIQPAYPETGYGYIEGGRDVSGGALRVRRFVEKPDLETAEGYVAAGNFFWNSGMFAFRASVMQKEFERHQPGMLREMASMLATDSAPVLKDYEALEDISIDYAIMEKTGLGVVLPSNFGWSDIGSWKSLYDFLPKDGRNNVIDGDVITQETSDSFVMGHSRLIAVNRLSRVVVVETPDSVFVSDMDTSREVKSIVTRLKATGRRESYAHNTVHHAWGTLKTIETGEDYRVERVVVYPGQTLRIEPQDRGITRLTVARGKARVRGADDFEGEFSNGEVIPVTGKEAVEMENPGPLSLHLIQLHMAEG